MNKVCFIIPTSEVGGIETYLLRFLTVHSTDLNAVVLVTGKRGGLADSYERLGVRLLYHKVGYFSLKNFYWLYKFYKQEKFNTICDFNGNFAGVPIFIAKMANIGDRIAFYRRSSNAFKPSKLRLIYNGFINILVKKYSTLVLSNSNYALDYFFPDRSIFDKKYEVILNGVPIHEKRSAIFRRIQKKLDLKNTDFIIGHIGRIDPSKNHETILKVAKALSSFPVKFIFCGKGTDSQSFIEKVKELDLLDSIILLGQVTKIYDILPIFNLFYFPSITEGQPNALIEAMVMDVPILASNIAPIKEIIPQKSHQLLIDPYDSNGAIGRIKEFIRDRSQLDNYQYGHWARSKFDMQTNFIKFLNVLK